MPTQAPPAKRPRNDDIAFGKGMPANLDAERFVLGAIILDDTQFLSTASLLKTEDFSLEKHRIIWDRMLQLSMRGEKIDRVTLANEIMAAGKLEAVDGLTYLISLDDGMPQLSELSPYIRIIKDKASKRQLAYASQAIINLAISDSMPASEILEKATQSVISLSADLPTQGLTTAAKIIEDYPGGIEKLVNVGAAASGLRTGYRKLDQMTGGLHPGELTLLAARPSMGKTALALNIAENILKPGKKVAIFSLEMTRESLLLRMASAMSRVDSQKIRSGAMSQEERMKVLAAFTALSEYPLWIDDKSNAMLVDIHAQLRRVQNESGLDLAIIDYLQLMNSVKPGERYDNRVTQVSALSRGLKLAAKDLGIPLLVLSQLTRGPDQRGEDHRPMLSDLRESGSLEQDADNVWFLLREEVYKKDRTDLRGMAELINAKQRNGPTGTVKLAFLNAYTRFENVTTDMGLPPEDANAEDMEM